jgi:hypothetical protein
VEFKAKVDETVCVTCKSTHFFVELSKNRLFWGVLRRFETHAHNYFTKALYLAKTPSKKITRKLNVQEMRLISICNFFFSSKINQSLAYQQTAEKKSFVVRLLKLSVEYFLNYQKYIKFAQIN